MKTQEQELGFKHQDITLTIQTTDCSLCKKRKIEEKGDLYCFICEERLFEAQQEASLEARENEELQNGY